MYKHAALIGLAIFAASPVALAANNNTSANVQSYGSLGSASVNLSINDSHGDGSEAVAISLPGTAAFTGGFTGESKATSSDTELTTSSKATLASSVGSPVTFSSGQASSRASTFDSQYFGNASGKVRFHLDYTLEASGKNAMASLYFWGNAFGSYNPNVDTSASFSDSLSINSGSAKKNGSWSSGWLEFSSDNWSWTGFTYDLHTDSSVNRWNQVLGSSNANTQVQFSYELDIPTGNTPPVPEPETYAMLLAGLGVIGIATRHRTQRG